MKLKTIALCLLAIGTAAKADIVAQWTFNTSPANVSFDLTTPPTAVGSGTASRIGGVTATSAGGSTNDPVVLPGTNNAWNTATYPAASAANKTAGVNFAVNTTGYTNISLSFDYRQSGTASRYLRVQYTTNGSTFVDLPAVSNFVANPFITVSNNLSAIPGANNNPNFAMRVVSEWESTAIGNANANYVGVSSGYGTSGTTRFDLVTVWGDLAGALNTPPTMTALNNQTIRTGSSTNQPFVVTDLETPATSLIVTGICSNPTLVPTANIVVTSPDGSGSNRLVTVTPVVGQVGSGTITLFVVDQGTLYTTRSFTLTVLPVNTPPVMAGLVSTNTLQNTPVTIPFTIGDGETAAASLSLSSNSTYTTILPLSGISFGGSGSNRTVTITPALNQVGVAVASVTVSDGALSTNITFSVMVTPTTNFLFYETFSYNNAPLVGPNTGNLWQHHSGSVVGEIAASDGQAIVDEAYTEDINGRLIGSPYYPTNPGSIYTACKFNLQFPPAVLDPSTNVGTYFLHLKDDGTVNFRARVIIATTNAAAGKFRLAIANSTSTNIAVQYPTDLEPGVDYTIVTRYDMVSGLSTLWVNPAAETDFSVTATDPAIPNLITAVALRQSATIGSLLVDDLFVATTFHAALGNVTPSPNTPPVIYPVGTVAASSGVATPPISVTIGDAETAAGSLQLTAVSSNQTLLPDANIVLGGSDSDRTLTITPAAGQYGTVGVLVKVTDGVFTNQISFLVIVNPTILLADTFSYLDGSLVTNSSFLYTNFGGTNGDMLVADGKLSLSFRRSEDAAAPLTNGPFATSSGVILYAGMTVNFSELPGSSYFAYFKDAASSFRGKIFATTSNAASGSFRFAVMNTGSTLDATNPVFGQDITLNSAHRVILRYEVTTGVSTLWVDPADEGDSSITGNDFAGPVTISTFAFRQNAGMGVLTLDDLLVGTTFAAVLGEAPSPRLTIQKTGAHSVTLSWPSSASLYSLVSATNNPAGPYSAYPDQGATQGSEKVVTVNDSVGTVFFQLKK